MPIIPPSLNPLTGLPKKKTPAAPTNYGLGGESKADSPFTNPILPGTTTSASSPSPQLFPGSATVPGFVPDYAGLLNADPILGQAKSDLGAQGITDAASRNAAINRALVQFGGNPDLNAAQQALGFNLGEVIDPTTSALAAQNQYSTQNVLGGAHTDAIRQIRRALAARGGLQSGELGYQLGQEGKAFGQAQNDATQSLLDHIGGYQSSYVEGQRQAQAAIRQAQQEAAARQAALNPATGAQTATFAYADADGNPVYRGADGKFYDLNGNAYGGPGQAQAAPQQQQQQAPAAQAPAPQEQYDPPVNDGSTGIPLSLSGNYTPLGETGIPLSVGGSYSTTGRTGIPLAVAGNYTLPNAYNTNRNKRG